MKYSAIILSCCISFAALAQEPPPLVQQRLEAEGEASGEDPVWLAELERFRRHPLPLNSVQAASLEELGLLSPLQISSFFRYRDLLGSFLHVYELQAVPHWDLATIRRVMPFVRIEPPQMKEAVQSRLSGTHQLLWRWSRTLEPSAGFNTSRSDPFRGDANQWLLQYRYQFKTNLYWGLTLEKDAGEKYLNRGRPDFTGFHLYARDLGIFKTLAIGDYSVNMGQGLLVWQGFGGGKSAEVMLIQKTAPNLSVYRSPGEFRFSRGAAFTLEKRALSLTGFFSHRNLSASVGEDSLQQYSGLNTSGLHRTATEIGRKGQLPQMLAGGSLQYRKGAITMAWNSLWQGMAFNRERSDEPYQSFLPRSGKQWLNSISWAVTFRNLHFFGEAAIDQQSQPGLLAGALISLHSRVDLSLLARSYARGYASMYGDAFAESGSPSNESGLFAGMLIRPKQGHVLQAYLDLFSFPWLRYRLPQPGRGKDFLLQWTASPAKHLHWYIRFRSEEKPSLMVIERMQVGWPVVRKQLRWHWDWQGTARLALHSRVEGVWWRQGSVREEGWLIYFEGRWKHPARWGGSLRWQHFTTGGWNSRVYAFEQQVLYGSGMPANYGVGSRIILLAHFSIGKSLRLDGRFAQTLMRDRKEIGSGLMMVPRAQRTDLRLQLIWEWK